MVGAALFSGALALAPLTAMAGGPVGATLQTEGLAGLAVHGNAAAAKLSVVVTRPNGKPATGFHAAPGAILPGGWSVLSAFNMPPGGCAVMPVAFSNLGAGIYTIDVVPAAGCLWVAGEHHYVVSISKNGRRGGNGNGEDNGGGAEGNVRASTLGSFEVPEPPPPVLP